MKKKETKILQTQISKELYDWLKVMAKNERRSVSNYVANILNDIKEGKK